MNQKTCRDQYCCSLSDPCMFFGSPGSSLYLMIRLVMKTPEQGGDTIVHAVTGQDLTQACHLENHRAVRVSSWAGNNDNQDKLWRVTCDMLSINTFGQ